MGPSALVGVYGLDWAFVIKQAHQVAIPRDQSYGSITGGLAVVIATMAAVSGCGNRQLFVGCIPHPLLHVV